MQITKGSKHLKFRLLTFDSLRMNTRGVVSMHGFLNKVGYPNNQRPIGDYNHGYRFLGNKNKYPRKRMHNKKAKQMKSIPRSSFNTPFTLIPRSSCIEL